MEPNHIYQFSLLNALMDGVSTSGIPVRTLLSKGNQGLGTFARMNGELIFLDDKIYQLQAEGSVREASPDEIVPFAVSTNFQPQKTAELELGGKDAVDGVLEALTEAKAKNLFVTYRIHGRFGYLKARTVRGQSYDGEPLADLGKKQSVEEYEDVVGTIVGFRTPKNWQGFGVAGEHLHFIDDERRRGGHVLEVRSAGKVKVQMSVCANVHVELPTGEDFNKASLITDDEGVKGVEG